MARHAPWYATPAGRARLQRDREIVREKLPGLKYGVPKGDSVEARGFVFMKAPQSKIITEVPAYLIFDKDYWRNPPSAFVIGRSFGPHDATRHFMSDGSCCLNLLRVDDLWDPNDDDALAPWLDQLIIFFYRQQIFDRTGRWPGPAHRHGEIAYADNLRETLREHNVIEAFLRFRSSPTTSFGESPCPCGRGSLLSACHGPTFVDLLTKFRDISNAVLSAALSEKQKST